MEVTIKQAIIRHFLSLLPKAELQHSRTKEFINSHDGCKLGCNKDISKRFIALDTTFSEDTCSEDMISIDRFNKISFNGSRMAFVHQSLIDEVIAKLVFDFTVLNLVMLTLQNPHKVEFEYNWAENEVYSNCNFSEGYGGLYENYHAELFNVTVRYFASDYDEEEYYDGLIGIVNSVFEKVKSTANAMFPNYHEEIDLMIELSIALTMAIINNNIILASPSYDTLISWMKEDCKE